MKQSLKTVCTFLAILPCLFAYAKPVELESDINAVTVYADRALVTRTGALSVPEGLSHVSISRLPAWIDTGSIRAELSPRGAAEIVEIQVKKQFQAKPDNDTLHDAEAAVQEMNDKLRLLTDELELLNARRQQVEGLAVFNIEKIPRGLA